MDRMYADFSSAVAIMMAQPWWVMLRDEHDQRVIAWQDGMLVTYGRYDPDPDPDMYEASVEEMADGRRWMMIRK